MSLRSQRLMSRMRTNATPQGCKALPWLIFILLLGPFAACAHPPAKSYDKVKAEVVAMHDSLAQRYAATGEAGKTKLVGEARKRILHLITSEIFPAWLGTPWDFNGVTQKPREGQIACGYFVTTVLRDAGFGVERAKLAQQASLKIIQVLCPKEERRDWSNIDVPELVRRVKALPQGLYIVGLDIHTGFIWNGPQSVDFVHASYGKPREVVWEHALESKVLPQSKRFVLGRVDNDDLLRKWLRKEAIPTV